MSVNNKCLKSSRFPGFSLGRGYLKVWSWFSACTVKNLINNFVATLIISWKSKTTIHFPNYFSSFMTEVPLHCKSMDWFLYDKDLRRERVKNTRKILVVKQLLLIWSFPNLNVWKNMKKRVKTCLSCFRKKFWYQNNW